MTTIQINRKALQALLTIADNDRARAINAILSGTSTIEDRRVVASMLAKQTIAQFSVKK